MNTYVKARCEDMASRGDFCLWRYSHGNLAGGPAKEPGRRRWPVIKVLVIDTYAYRPSTAPEGQGARDAVARERLV